MKIGMVNLGCEKNHIDGEILMAALKNTGYELSDDAALADIAIINTCGFIESAKRESIDEILELAKLKAEGRIKYIVVTGCLAERYREELMRELPECDACVGIGANADIAGVIGRMINGERVGEFPPKERLPLCGERELTTPSYFAYIKIAEGCDNRCTYCAIPNIRGTYRSRPMEDIVSEAAGLVKNGAKELILIAQDTTRYGLDLYGHLALPELLTELCSLDGLKWLRLLYCYPDFITDDLIKKIADEDKIVKYIDIPLQHASGNVLHAMHRHGDRQSLTALMDKLRAKIPGLTLRTTVMTGFPGETDEDFGELMRFIRDIRFERLGCFTYSAEEDTPAALFENQVDEDIKERRAELINEEQMLIMQENGEAMVGSEVTVLTEGFDRYAECFFGRTSTDAPDIDGKVFFTAPVRKPYYGELVRVRIDDCMDCDLVGEMLEDKNESTQ